MKTKTITGIILLLLIGLRLTHGQSTRTIYYNYDGSGNRVQRIMAPNAPIVGTVTQPSCTVATGSVELSGLPSGNWTINTLNEYGDVASAPITGTGTSTTITGLEPGSEPWAYTFTVTNSNIVTSPKSATVTINYHLQTPERPTVTNQYVQYCQDATATQLTATGIEGYTLKWYTTESQDEYGTGSSTTIAPTPSTSSVGSTDYYVSQIDNDNICESKVNYIVVSVSPKQSAPNINNSDGTTTLIASDYTDIVSNVDSCFYLIANADTTTIANFIVTNTETSAIKIFPNPVTEIVNVQFTGMANYEGSSLKIYDGTGKLFLNKEALQQHNEISMQSASKGSYFMVIITKDKKRQYWKLVKE